MRDDGAKQPAPGAQLACAQRADLEEGLAALLPVDLAPGVQRALVVLLAARLHAGGQKAHCVPTLSRSRHPC